MGSVRSVGVGRRVAPWLLAAALVLGPFATLEEAGSWGFYGHKRINRMACFTLPPEMFPFFKRHIDFISDHAVDPDRRRYADPEEAPRHYIDIDHYAHGGQDAFAVMPAHWTEAVAKFSEDTLKAYGIVPWHIALMEERLTKAFLRGDVDGSCAMLRTSATISPMPMCPAHHRELQWAAHQPARHPCLLGKPHTGAERRQLRSPDGTCHVP
ncbi:MAG: hypothetical protein IPG10_08880 [Flavobacteriales bacterium]|nr:hypothetical protein [Flavobacteriales bacterium]